MIILINRMLLAVTSPNGDLLGVFTSGVDAHLCWKGCPGARTWSCAPNSSSPKILTEARSNQSISCRLSQSKGGDDTSDSSNMDRTDADVSRHEA